MYIEKNENLLKFDTECRKWIGILMPFFILNNKLIAGRWQFSVQTWYNWKCHPNWVLVFIVISLPCPIVCFSKLVKWALVAVYTAWKGSSMINPDWGSLSNTTSPPFQLIPFPSTHPHNDMEWVGLYSGSLMAITWYTIIIQHKTYGIVHMQSVLYKIYAKYITHGYYRSKLVT